MKSIINANSLSPWSDELDLDAFLAPPPAPPLSGSAGGGGGIQQEAKKTLLSIDVDKKRSGRSQIREYLVRKNKNQLSHMSVQEAYDFKLPPIKPYDSIDYSAQELLFANGFKEIDLFRKYGDHRRSKLHEGSKQNEGASRMQEGGSRVHEGSKAYEGSRVYEGNKVQRSISYGGSERREKAVTLQPIAMDSLQREVKALRLKGKKYSFELRVESERKLSSDQYKYIPSQPNITPHYLLFGHSKQDVLKKVLQQINQKIK